MGEAERVRLLELGRLEDEERDPVRDVDKVCALLVLAV